MCNRVNGRMGGTVSFYVCIAILYCRRFQEVVNKKVCIFQFTTDIIYACESGVTGNAGMRMSMFGFAKISGATIFSYTLVAYLEYRRYVCVYSNIDTDDLVPHKNGFELKNPQEIYSTIFSLLHACTKNGYVVAPSPLPCLKE